MLDPNRFDLKNLLDSGYMNPLTALRSQFANPNGPFNGEPTQVEPDPMPPPPPPEPKSILVPQPMLGLQRQSGSALSGLMT